MVPQQYNNTVELRYYPTIRIIRPRYRALSLFTRKGSQISSLFDFNETWWIYKEGQNIQYAFLYRQPNIFKG